jgi:hypothetical protein
MSVDRQTALKQLGESNMVALTTRPKVGVLPFFCRYLEYWQDLKEWCDRNLLRVHTVDFGRYVVTVYVQRPSEK